jgi:hypothetical protein
MPGLAHVGYLLAFKETAVAIDPQITSVSKILDDLEVYGLKLKAVLVTHRPFDVVTGKELEK